MPNESAEDLEEELRELRATVTGLTEELVEANERIRQIEKALAGDAEAARNAARGPVAGNRATGDEREDAAPVETVEGADPEEVAQAAARAELANAGPAPSPTFDAVEDDGGEGNKAEGHEGSDEADGELDDIIVA